ncbi:MAG: O-antigen ligase family protein, partial [Bacteroidetes bacterium]|nr:O-antigen ligase family protein [Bacteroidota bacterium]
MSRQIHRNIYLISLVLAVGSLPLSRAVLSIATIVLLLNWIVERNFRDKWNLLKKHPIAWLFAGFFLLHLFSGLYTDAPGMFQQDLVVKIPLLIVPLVIISSPSLTVEESKYVFKAMILGGLLATLYCLIIAFDENITHGFTLTRLWNCWWAWGCEDGNAFLNYRYFTYENFSSALSLHPTYFALFLNLSCVFIVWIWRDEWKTYKRFSHIGWAILLVYFFGMILMLSSRMKIINFLIIGLGGLFVYGWKSRRIALSFSLIAVIGFLAGTIILANPQNRARFLDLFEDEPLEVEEVHHSGSEVRKYIWRISFNLISESFWLGYGSGDIKDVR